MSQNSIIHLDARYYWLRIRYAVYSLPKTLLDPFAKKFDIHYCMFVQIPHNTYFCVALCKRSAEIHSNHVYMYMGRVAGEALKE